jgi:hypothetical protein
MKTRFAHIRHFDTRGEYLAKGGETFCYTILDDGTLRVSSAMCSLKDNYCRRIGRDVALGRMLNGRYTEYPLGTYHNGNIVNFILDN